MSPPIGLSQRDGVGWGGVGGGGGAGHVPSLKGLQALVGFETPGYVVEPNSRAKDGESNVGATLWQVMAVWQTNRCHK